MLNKVNHFIPGPISMDQLIEMGKKFYPELTWGYQMSEIHDTTVIFMCKDEKITCVHWYEFLVRWILPLMPFRKRVIFVILYSDNPIDLVYHHFKTL